MVVKLMHVMVIHEAAGALISTAAFASHHHVEHHLGTIASLAALALGHLVILSLPWCSASAAIEMHGLVRSAARNSAELLNLHALHGVCELVILLLETHVFALNSLEVAHAILKFLIEFSDALVILLLHVTHLFLDALHELLLLLIVARPGTFNHV